MTQWPQTIRIMLSGSCEFGKTIRLVPYAHQYVTKPCEPRQIENVVDRCLQLHELLDQPRLRAIVGRIQKLPTLPQVYAALQGVLCSDTTTVQEVAKIVSRDAAIAARVLQVVNSAFFRLARRMTNIEQAVSYLGFNAIRNIAASVEIFSQWQGRESSDLDLGKLQLHVHEVAAAAHALAAKTPLADDAMLTGLLHDIGYWVLAQECATDLKTAVALAAQSRIPLYEAETRVLGASHAEIGAYLLGLWGLPYPIIEGVAHHHCPERVVQSEFDVLAAVAVGHSLAPSDDSNAFGATLVADPRVDETYLAALHAGFDWNEAARRVSERLQSQEVHT